MEIILEEDIVEALDNNAASEAFEDYPMSPLEAVSTAVVLLSLSFHNHRKCTVIFLYVQTLTECSEYVHSIPSSGRHYSSGFSYAIKCCLHFDGPMEVWSAYLQNVAHMRCPLLHSFNPPSFCHSIGSVLGYSRSHKLCQ
ncbi:hypothetical protein TNIN_406751 [Trichonephila inaurata madagascariensis]|uniref:Uncharacterized protein n=1 Tax=Trichonephila inaurata madagascariensis TaxID=2747483 RepID=A0A8X6Y3J1_9ARAC|nr:hypothetical protein TNIN_406751 [Trichonephila inaurata madagascariensis]